MAEGQALGGDDCGCRDILYSDRTALSGSASAARRAGHQVALALTRSNAANAEPHAVRSGEATS